MNKIYILAFMLLLSQTSWAQIRDFQTTRLNSTAGAGVASVLSTEAAVLNPAASGFFTGSSFSYQAFSTSLRHENDDRDAADDDFPSRNKSQGFFVSDHDGPVKGGLAYLKQDENDFTRKQIVTHAAAPIGQQTSMGFTYKYVQDERPKEFSRRREISHKLVTGITHIVDDKTIVGMVLVDPTRTGYNEERLLLGFQYSFAEKLTLILDLGTQYTKDVKDKHIWRGALQLQLFDDFFFRAGRFYDNVRQEKGMGWGAGWIGPRLGVEFAQKISEQFGKDYYIYQDESLVDTSLSLIIKF